MVTRIKKSHEKSRGVVDWGQATDEVVEGGGADLWGCATHGSSMHAAACTAAKRILGKMRGQGARQGICISSMGKGPLMDRARLH